MAGRWQSVSYKAGYWRPAPHPQWRFGWWTGPIQDQQLFTGQDRAWLHRMWALTGQPAGFLTSSAVDLSWITHDRIRG